jgi:hypothetical protein
MHGDILFVIKASGYIFFTIQNDVPSPFPIPTFRQSTTKNLEKDVLTDPDRRYMVQTIATVLMTYVQRPSLDSCNAVAKSVIDKYPFLKDNIGEGQVSYRYSIRMLHYQFNISL